MVKPRFPGHVEAPSATRRATDKWAHDTMRPEQLDSGSTHTSQPQEGCALLHPLQGVSLLSTPLQGGILKPPALRVVGDCSVTMLVLLASLCRMAACKRWVSIRCLWSAYCTYSLTNCKYPWWPPRLFQRSTDVRIFRKHARISLSVLSPSKGTWIRVLASCRPSRNSHIV